MATISHKDESDRKVTKAIVHLLHIRKTVSTLDDEGNYHPRQELGTYLDGINDALDILNGVSPREILKR